MTQPIGRTLVGVLLLVSACGSGEDPGNGTSIPSAELCAAQFDAFEDECPQGAENKDARVQSCKVNQRDYAGIGCQDEFDAWLQCTTGSGFSCQDDTGCEQPQSGYFLCRSQAAQRTGCSRLASQDPDRCSDPAKPFAFSCLTNAPASCVQVVTAGAGIWCCPQI